MNPHGNDDDDDDEEDDEDFMPSEHSESGDEGEGDEEEAEEPPKKKRKVDDVDDLWNDMNKKVEKKPDEDLDALWAEMNSTSSTPKPSAAATSKPSSASNVISSKTPDAQKDTAVKVPELSIEEIVKQVVSSDSTGMSLSEMMGETKEAKKTVTEVYKFAGEKITVTKEVAEDTPDQQGRGKKKQAPGGNLGQLLSNLGGPKKMSTIQKSSMDWDKFKTEQKLEDELKLQAKGGYLEKQAFLQRADERQFEVEKEKRDRDRARASKK